MDDNLYTHYFMWDFPPSPIVFDFFSLSTVEANWDLGSLGRGDTSKTLANVFASVTGYKNIGLTSSPELAHLNLTKTISGPLNPQYHVPYLEPNASATGGGRMHLCLSTYGH